VLRTSRFFPEDDDNLQIRNTYADENIKANEYLYRRVALDDAVDAHLLAIARAPAIGFDRFIISATTPFTTNDLERLRTDAPGVVREHVPEYVEQYAKRGWTMFPGIDRVYVNQHARDKLGWRPRFDFRHAIDRLGAGENLASPLARAVGSKGYHVEPFSAGRYPL
jgi:UDP-glucose 4-epimerase